MSKVYRAAPTGPPPARIKRDATKEMFPQLAVESTAQNKLFKLANSISGYSKDVEKPPEYKSHKTQELHERLEELKREHFMHVKGGGVEYRIPGTISPPLEEPSFARPTTS